MHSFALDVTVEGLQPFECVLCASNRQWFLPKHLQKERSLFQEEELPRAHKSLLHAPCRLRLFPFLPQRSDVQESCCRRIGKHLNRWELLYVMAGQNRRALDATGRCLLVATAVVSVACRADRSLRIFAVTDVQSAGSNCCCSCVLPSVDI